MESRNKVQILSHIPVDLTVDRVLKQMRLHGDSRRFAGMTEELIRVVAPLARPKAVYKIGCVNNKGPDFVEIDGIKFTDRLLVEQLGKVESVFVCVSTCGTEVEAVDIPSNEVMKRYCLDAVKLVLVVAASEYLQARLERQYGTGSLSSLNPGELKSFPIEQQRNLFAILGDVEGMIGVRLTENCAMVPTKSRSGIYFPSDTGFVSCRLCSMSRCQGRKAAYDPQLAGQYDTE
ncbi:MAG: vitamin B12 dependent-methionine synthase activation domain-containing protein [Dehalococcoidales bacterium]|nr:vitamin B12 dependent-methionine synthase activation domain-containing protein [Dehalococcoidales bacterium]